MAPSKLTGDVAPLDRRLKRIEGLFLSDAMTNIKYELKQKVDKAALVSMVDERLARKTETTLTEKAVQEMIDRSLATALHRQTSANTPQFNVLSGVATAEGIPDSEVTPHKDQSFNVIDASTPVDRLPFTLLKQNYSSPCNVKAKSVCGDDLFRQKAFMTPAAKSVCDQLSPLPSEDEDSFDADSVLEMLNSKPMDSVGGSKVNSVVTHSSITNLIPFLLLMLFPFKPNDGLFCSIILRFASLVQT